MSTSSMWRGPGDKLGQFVTAQSQASLNAYRVRPELVREHDNIERATVEGGYGRKQLNELVQNAADAMDGLEGRIKIVLTEDALYCANEGMPLQEKAVRTLLLSHSSEKRDDQIGRFGLGFKSVLQVSDSPEIISRTVSLRWSRQASAACLREIVPHADGYPVLRLAEPFDPAGLAAMDPVLAELMEWAVTIVRLPLKPNVTWLDEEMRLFPAEFLLFSDKIGTLDFDNRRTGKAVTWTATRDENKCVLSNGESTDTWSIFRRTHKVSPASAADAGSIAARDEVEITWAVPWKRRNRLGQFWNYFPTNSYTSLSGIVNAAFKMNEDRQNMLDGLYNGEMLKKTLPLIVATCLPELVDPEDPGSVLEILPARGKEARSWADEVLNIPVMQAVASLACLPDREGNLRPLREIRVQPDLPDAPAILDLWENAVPISRPWAHRSSFRDASRNATMVRLLNYAGVSRASVSTWLEEIVQDRTLEGYAKALEIAVLINSKYPELQEGMRQSRIVLAADKSVQRPLIKSLFIPVDDQAQDENLIAPELVAYGDVQTYLRKLDFSVLNAEGQLRKIFDAVLDNPDDVEAATSMWRLSRSVPVPEMSRTMSERFPNLSIPVRSLDGKWRKLSQVWLTGRLFPATEQSDPHLRVDEMFHRPDLQLLRNLGARNDLGQPEWTSSGTLYSIWKESIGNEIAAGTKETPNPVSSLHLTFAKAMATPGLETLANASEGVRFRAVQRLLSTSHYQIAIKVNNAYRNDIHVDDPDIWWIRNFGVLETGLGLTETRYCVGAVEGFPRGYLTCPTTDDAIKALKLSSAVSDVNWTYVYEAAARRLDLRQLHQLYGLAAAHGASKPKQVWVKTKSSETVVPLADVHIATDEATFNYLCDYTEEPALYTDHAELDSALQDLWKLDTLTIEFITEYEFDVDGETSTVGRAFKHIDRVVRGISRISLHPCSEIRRIESNNRDDWKRVTSLPSVKRGDDIYYVAPLTPEKLLQTVLDLTGAKSSDAVKVLRMLNIKKKEAEAEARIRDANSKKTDEEKILALVGESTIRALIPDHVYRLVDSRLDDEMTPQRLFQIASTLHGTNLIKKIKPALEALGIETPIQFRGSKAAREFIDRLGISGDYAGRSEAKKPAREEVVGPVRLAEMHDYQEDVSKKVRELLDGKGPQRGIVQLPTGSGKTRVAVESVIQHVKERPDCKLVVWIAQTEELCEQAVDSWAYVWQAIGATGERMAISRLWGGNRCQSEETKLHVVVATVQTISSIISDRPDQYEWLRDSDVLIIDEAHTAITSSYTNLLQWFKRGRTERDKPLIGLSATPYRGTNEKQTKQLVNRFDGNLITPGQFNAEGAHEYLQKMGVLAQVKHQELEGIELELLPMRSAQGGDEQSRMLEARLDLDVVAGSRERNNAILDHIKSRKEESTAIVFAASVEHAEALAATLTIEGVKSAAISAQTDGSDRRRLIEEFRRGEVRVLTNFDVLSQGFDAPKVGAVYVCRPTFSPNRYLQMIGRGLRGPKNGGSQEVLIVNVRDNLKQFGEQLAFNHFDYLWNRT